MEVTPFEFEYDPATHLLRLKLIGLRDNAILSAFVAEARVLRDRVQRAGHQKGGGRVLIDLRNFLVQLKSITDGIGQLLPTFGMLAGRIAIVRSSSALQHMQVQRLTDFDNVRAFDAPDEAVACLATSDL